MSGASGPVWPLNHALPITPRSQGSCRSRRVRVGTPLWIAGGANQAPDLAFDIHTTSCNLHLRIERLAITASKQASPVECLRITPSSSLLLVFHSRLLKHTSSCFAAVQTIISSTCLVSHVSSIMLCLLPTALRRYLPI